MKKALILSLVFCASQLAAFAQMDEKFYFPKKERAAITEYKYEDISLISEGGTVTGIFIKPAQKPKTTVLFFHGAGGNVSTYTFMTKPLVDHGYQVLAVDFRGYGKSSGKPTHLNVAKDGQLMLDYLLKRPEVKGTPVVVYGASMGSQVATKLARENQAKINALVLDGAISSFTDIAADSSPEAQRAMIRQYLTSPYSAKEDVKHIANLPKLFIHSKEDKDVPYAQGQAVFTNAQEPKQFYTYEGKHLEALKTNPKEVLAKMDELLKRN